MLIDFHTHILPPWVREDRDLYSSTDPLFALLYSDPKARLATAEELIADMDNYAVDLAVVHNITWMSNEMCRKTNDYLLESASKYPRLLPFCAVYPGDIEGALKEMSRCGKGGAKGFGELRLDMPTRDTSSPYALAPLFELASSLDLPILIHASEPVGHGYAGKGSATPDFLSSVLSVRSKATVILAHWGGGLPFYSLMPEVDRLLEDTFFDTAASPLLYRPQIYSIVAGLVGPQRVLFGSDYPLIGYRRPLADIGLAPLSQKARGLILGENARRLLGI